jgi:hypothetical protein
MPKFRDPAEAYGHKLRKMCLERDLPEVVSEPIFGVSWLVEAFCHQRFDPLLGGGSSERSDAGIPPGAVDLALGADQWQ